LNFDGVVQSDKDAKNAKDVDKREKRNHRSKRTRTRKRPSYTEIANASKYDCTAPLPNRRTPGFEDYRVRCIEVSYA
jgi:hypothetical protein